MFSFSGVVTAAGSYLLSDVQAKILAALKEISEKVTNQMCDQFGSAELDREKIQAIVNNAAVKAKDNLKAEASFTAIMSLDADAFLKRAMLELVSEALLGIYSTNAHHPQDGHKLSMSSIASAYDQLCKAVAIPGMEMHDEEASKATVQLIQEASALALVKELRNRTEGLKKFLKNTTEYNQLMAVLNSKKLTSQQKIEQYTNEYMRVRDQLKSHTTDKGNPFLRKLGHFVMTILTAGIYGVVMAVKSYKERRAVSFWKSDSEVEMHRLERRIPRLG